MLFSKAIFRINLIIIIVFAITNIVLLRSLEAKDNLTLALPFAKTDKLQTEIISFTKKITIESSDQISVEIKNLDQSSNLIDKVLEESIDLAWIMSDYNPGRYSWLKLFTWPGVTVPSDQLIRNLHEIYSNFLNNKRDFFGVRVLAFGIYPQSKLLTNLPYKDFEELSGKKIRCRNIDCESYLAKLGLRGLSYQDEEITNLLKSNNIVGILHNPSIGRNIHHEEGIWEKELKYRVVNNFNWGRIIGMLVISDTKWASLDEDTRRLLSYYSGINLSIALTKILNPDDTTRKRQHKSNLSEIDLLRPKLDAAYQKIWSWRKESIKNIRNISPVILEEIDNALTKKDTR